MRVQTETQAETLTQTWKQRVPFVAYLVLFFALWTGWVLWIYPHVAELGQTTLTYALLNIALRLLLWVVPVFLYLRFVDRVNPLEYLKLTRYWQRGIVVGLALSLVNFGGTLLRFGPPQPSIQYVTWNSILGTSILIGIIEEIPFRGFIFQKLQESSSFWKANLLSSLLFVGIHLPGWFSSQVFTLTQAITIFLIGVILAAASYFSRSLWSSIVAHSLNDFFASVLFHVG